jgi:hypothetical protein
MFFLATLHPNLTKDDENYDKVFYTEEEKRIQIEKFYRDNEFIPLNVDHKSTLDQDGFNHVAEEDCVGRVVDLFNSKDGKMMLKMQLDMTHPFYSEINKSIFEKNEKWGVSVWIEGVRDPVNHDRYSYKKLAHVALTKDPLFSEHGTFLHDWQLLEPRVDHAIATKYCTMDGNGSFSAGRLKDKLKGVFLFDPLSGICSN